MKRKRTQKKQLRLFWTWAASRIISTRLGNTITEDFKYFSNRVGFVRILIGKTYG